MRIASFVGQKGGVGKSTLARVLAVAAAREQYKVLIGDFDLEQLTCVEWSALRMRHGIEPDIDAQAFKSLKKLRKSVTDYDLVVVVGDIRQLMSLLALVTQALLLLSIMASVLILFRLLLPQFVKLRAIGAPRSYLFAFAWGFTSLLVGLGALLGLGGGYALSFGISAWLSQQTGVSLQPSLGAHELLMTLAIFAVGLLLASLPAWHLQRLPLASAIKLN